MPPLTPANAPAVTAIRCDHHIQTREGNAARRCTEQVPLTSFWGNQTGYESRLHCLQQDLDSQTQGYHQGRPHSWHGLPAHSAGVATSKEAYSANGQGILGLQRPALHRRGTAPDGPQNCHSVCLREEYLQRLHQGHLSATKVQQNARQHLYWPGLDADIADYTRRCQECICRSQPPKEPLQAHEVPQEPWERIAMDYFYMNGRLYILICDYFSKFPFLFQVKTMSFANLKDHLEELLSVEGIPDEIMSDNGPPFNGKEFSSYLTGLGIRHTTSSPNYPRSNGFIERQIQTMKRLIEKANSSGRSHQEALTGLRAQPLGDCLPSPSEILHGRSLVTRKASPVDFTAVRQSLIALQAKYTKSHDKAKRTKTQRALVTGEEVHYLSGKNEWQIGIVTGTTDTGRSYNIVTDEGTSLRRNRSHLKPRCHDIPIISRTLPSRTSTSSQSEITGKPLPGTKHPPKVKYFYNNEQNISFQDQYEQHPPKVKYFPNNNVPKLVISRVGDTAYDSYIAETLYPLKSAIKPRKQTRFAGDPVTSVKTIPARRTRSYPPK